jgi:hypothetical protein
MAEFEDDELNPTPGTDPSLGDNENFRQLREHAKELEKEMKAAKKDLADLNDLRAYKAEQEAAKRTSALGNTFKDLGLPAQQAALYPPDAEATPEAIRAFAEQYGLLAPQEGSPETPVETGFAPVPPVGETIGAKVYTQEEWLALSATNPNAAMQILNEGRLAEVPPAY